MDVVKIQKAPISLLRLVSEGQDDLAFEFCEHYRYFDELCELSVAHGKKQDATSYYALDDPLFETMAGTDSGSGRSFSQHVLQWHTDRGLFGQVINYGRHSVSDLNRIMEKNIALRQYRWIPTRSDKATLPKRPGCCGKTVKRTTVFWAATSGR